MKKKYGFAFLTIGILSLVVFCIYNYTSLFKNDNNIEDDTSSNKLIISDDYIKSHDIDKKTKFHFPIFDSLTLTEIYSDEYYRIYSNEDEFFLTAMAVQNNDLLNDYISKQNEKYEKIIKNDNMEIVVETIECQFSCVRYKLYNSDKSIYGDQLKIYYKPSPNNLFELSYYMEQKKLSDDVINTILNNLKVTYDATYTIGSVKDDKLNISFIHNKNISILLDSNNYIEVPSGYNSNKSTTVENINTGERIHVLLIYKKGNSTIHEYVNKYYNSVAPEEEVKVMNNIFYKYNVNNKNYYANIIDNESALLIEFLGNSIDINDFSNIVVKDV